MKLTIDKALQHAIEAHRLGNLQEAEALYRAVLQAEPTHPDANHNLGLLAVSLDKAEDALPLFKNALNSSPQHGQFWISYIDALIRTGHIVSANDVLERGRKLGLRGEIIDALEGELQLMRPHLASTDANAKDINRRASLNETGSNKHLSPPQTELHVLIQHYQGGRYDLAEKLAKAISQKHPDHPLSWKVLGALYQQTGKLQEALFANQRAVAISPSDPELHNNLSVTLRDLGKLDDAETRCRQAISIKPDYAQAHNNLGITQKELGRLEDAKASCMKAIAIMPDLPEAHNNLGIILQELGRSVDADASYRRAIEIKPQFAQAHTNLANNLQLLGQLEEAESGYLRAISLEPGFAKAHTNLGNVLRELGRLEEARTSYTKAISIKPELAEAHSNLGNTLKDLGRLEEAEASYRRAIAIKPGLAQAHSNLGMLLQRRGLWQEAVNSHRESVALEPGSVALRWCLTMSQLSSVYATAVDSQKSILQFEAELQNLDEFITDDRLKGAEKAVGKMQPYFIAYLDNNNKDLLSRYGNICHRVMRYWQEANNIHRFEERKNTGGTGKIRIGIISAQIRYHSVWNAFLKGIVTQINKDKFDLYIYYLDTKRDEETQIAEEHSFKFFSGRKQLHEWCELILQDDLDVAFFPEIGMHDKTLQLASMRLARSQCTSWGHPETSGLPTMDYYISAQLTEDHSSAENYSETLVCLDNLGCYFEPPSLETGDASFLVENGVDVDSNLLLCLGPPNKYHPDHDYIYVEILKGSPNCQFIFMKDDNGAYKIIQDRLSIKFKENGFSADNKIIFLPYLSRQGFNTLMSAGRVLLDTLNFSHFNTSMQALGCTLPVVSMRGRFMRSRATSGILKRIGMDELVASNPEMYICIVRRLINDGQYYQSVKSNIKNNAEILYRDADAIRSLENFFICH